MFTNSGCKRQPPCIHPRDIHVLRRPVHGPGERHWSDDAIGQRLGHQWRILVRRNTGQQRLSDQYLLHRGHRMWSLLPVQNRTLVRNSGNFFVLKQKYVIFYHKCIKVYYILYYILIYSLHIENISSPFYFCLYSQFSPWWIYLTMNVSK